MKNKITNFRKALIVLMLSATGILIGFTASAQNKDCNAGFELKTDGYNITATALTNTTDAELLWSFGDGAFDKQKTVSHTYANEGSYSVCLIVRRGYNSTSNLRRCTDTVCKRVEIKAPCRLKIDFGFETRGTIAHFKSDVQSNATDLVYKWEFGNGHTCDRPNPEFDFKEPGRYKVCLTVASRDGKCRETVCKVVEVKRDPCAKLQAAFRFKVDGKKAGFYSTTEGNNLVYEWTINGRKVSEKQGFRFTFKEPGKYIVCLIVKMRGTDCVSRICKEVEVKKPDPCANLHADFKYRQSGHKAAFFNATRGRNLTYEWTVNGHKVSENENFRFTFKEPGRYTVCLVVRIKGTRCVSRICKVVEVKRPEPCRLQSAFRYVVHGNKVALHNESRGENLHYTWVIDGQRVSNRENWITELRPGKHRVCLYITNRHGKCKDSYCTVIEIKRPLQQSPNTGNGGHNLTADAPPANADCNCKNEPTAQNGPVIEMNLFPNPAQDVLNITVSGVETASVIISSLNGTVYYSAQHALSESEALSLTIGHLPQGYYVAKVLAADGLHYATLKFYKQ